MRNDAAGWVLMEAVLLTFIVLAVAAAIGIFMRTALVQEHAAARMEAAFLVREQLSVWEAALDQGQPPRSSVTEVRTNNRTYQIETSVTRAEIFYDVHLRLSWQVLGREEDVEYVRRLRQHGRTNP